MSDIKDAAGAVKQAVGKDAQAIKQSVRSIIARSPLTYVLAAIGIAVVLGLVFGHVL